MIAIFKGILFNLQISFILNNFVFLECVYKSPVFSTMTFFQKEQQVVLTISNLEFCFIDVESKGNDL